MKVIVYTLQHILFWQQPMISHIVVDLFGSNPKQAQ